MTSKGRVEKLESAASADISDVTNLLGQARVGRKAKHERVNALSEPELTVFAYNNQVAWRERVAALERLRELGINPDSAHTEIARLVTEDIAHPRQQAQNSFGSKREFLLRIAGGRERATGLKQQATVGALRI